MTAPRLPALLLAFLALPAMADPVITWGGSSAALGACAEADACVTVINRLTASPALFAGELSAGGLRVEVEVVMGDGKEPDFVRVTPPRGWIVLPPTADVPEDGVAVFRLFAPEIG